MGMLDRIGAAVGDSTSKTDQALATEIAKSNNADAIAELTTGLDTADKKVQSSCIKAIYETGYLNPELIAEQWEVYLNLLDRKNNRLVWGGMIALSCIAPFKADMLIGYIDRIFRSAKYGTRITTDAGLITLGGIGATSPDYATSVMPQILELLADSPPNKLPAYTEATVIAVTPELKDDYLKLLRKRAYEMNDKQIKRVNKALKKIDASILI